MILRQRYLFLIDLANCQIADTIYFLKGGKIIETGSHDELMTKKGAYYELFKQAEQNLCGNDIKYFRDAHNLIGGETNMKKIIVLLDIKQL